MGRVLGIDYGSRRVGLALSDPQKIIASPFRTIRVVSDISLLSTLKTIIETENVELIVVGYPLGMKGQKTEQTKITEKFVDLLKQSVIQPIVWMDERLTSVEAIQSLRRQGYKPSRQKTLIDKTAAAIMLQTYLDRRASSQ